MSKVYELKDFGALLKHIEKKDAFVRDIANTPEGLAVDALVASGDCFELLASNFDQLSRSLHDNDPRLPELERSIRTLLYLQHHYKITKKDAKE